MTSTSSQSGTSAAKGRSLTEMVASTEAPAPSTSVPASTWLKTGVLGLLFVAAFWSWIRVMVSTWGHDSNWSHGYLIPLFSVYLIYVRWDELMAVRYRRAWTGLVLLLFALALNILCVYPLQTTYGGFLSVVMGLFGLVLFMCGWRAMLLLWLPVLYLLLAVPIPDRIYSLMSVPLQEMAAKASTTVLGLLGADIISTASQLTVRGESGRWYPLLVAEACSGVRSLMAFVALGVAMAYITDRPIWQRLVLLACIIPVTIFTNMIRVSITCYMYVIDRPELGQKFMHTFLGIAMLIPAAGILWLIGYVMDGLFVEDDEDSQPDSAEPSEEAQ